MPIDPLKSVQAALSRAKVTVIGFGDMQALYALAERYAGSEAANYAGRVSAVYANKDTPRAVADKLCHLVEAAQEQAKPKRSTAPVAARNIDEVNAASIEALDLGAPVIKHLLKQGLSTVGALKAYCLAGNALEEIPGIGAKSAEDIGKAVTAFKERAGETDFVADDLESEALAEGYTDKAPEPTENPDASREPAKTADATAA